MNYLNDRILVTLIQVMSRAVGELRAEIAETEGPEQADLQELFLDYTLAADALRDAYLAVYVPDSNMISYERLVTPHDA